MLKKLWLTLSLTLAVIWVESLPIGPVFDDLDSVDDYEEEDLDDFVDTDGKTDIKTEGYKNKNTFGKGVQSKHNLEDLKKFYKLVGLQNQGSYDDDDVYAVSDVLTADVKGARADVNRKYRKGSKTRGFHRIHHKDEYEKDRVFYEDDESAGNLKKVGGKAAVLRTAAGAGLHKGHFHHDHHKGVYGRQGYLDKGSLEKQFKGYSDAQGFDRSFSKSR